jgi:demethylmenaquinone methyltransferase / 2-methoxy-6-polyprenyl-1,4-benzoquinol methylase
MKRKLRSAIAASNPEAEWFGDEKITPTAKTARVRAVFDSVASRYDLMNDVMSLGLHRCWKQAFVAQIRPRAGQEILDLACGTGDIAYRLHQAVREQAKITLCDYNLAMLQRAQDRMIAAGLWQAFEWVVGDAAALPLDSHRFDLVTIAFGLRNVARIDDALREIHRVLKPGGRFYCLEFSPDVTPTLEALYALYSFRVLPWLGEVIAKDRASYQYLAESIRRFPKAENLAKRMEIAGFFQPRFQYLSGGIVAIHQGWKL